MAEAPLSMWRDGAVKSAITAFVGRVTKEGADFIPPDERVAVFDNDGTLWCEKAMPIQLDFILRFLSEKASQILNCVNGSPGNPRWRTTNGWAA
jgi:hypothetical protein